MNKNKNWALMAHADGICSFLRDLTGFKLGNLLKMPWNPEDEPVELVLNGEYQGLYYISETVKVGSNRVDIFDYDDAKEEWEEKHPGETFNWTDSYKTGGWLVEIDNNIDNDQIVLKTRGSDWYNLLVTYDTPSDYITQEHIDYLKSQFDTMDRLIYEGPDENLNWFDMIDLPDAARYFIANGLMDNLESLRGSCKIWKEQEGLEKTCAFLSDGKWHFGPLWDMGSSLYRNNNFRLFCDNDGYYAHWMPKMLEYPEFRNELKKQFTLLVDDPEKLPSLYDFIDSEAEKILQAAANDNERWPNYGNKYQMSMARHAKNFLKRQVELYKLFLGYEGESPRNIYLRQKQADGSWSLEEANRFQFTDTPGVFTLSLSHIPAGGEFKLGDHDWSLINFGGPGNIATDEPVTLNLNVDGFIVAKDITNPTLTFNLSRQMLTISDPSGVEIIGAAGENSVRYFNLQGLEISAPQPGTVCIKVSGNKAEKILYK